MKKNIYILSINLLILFCCFSENRNKFKLLKQNQGLYLNESNYKFIEINNNTFYFYPNILVNNYKLDYTISFDNNLFINDPSKSKFDIYKNKGNVYIIFDFGSNIISKDNNKFIYKKVIDINNSEYYSQKEKLINNSKKYTYILNNSGFYKIENEIYKLYKNGNYFFIDKLKMNNNLFQVIEQLRVTDENLIYNDYNLSLKKDSKLGTLNYFISLEDEDYILHKTLYYYEFNNFEILKKKNITNDFINELKHVKIILSKSKNIYIINLNNIFGISGEFIKYKNKINYEGSAGKNEIQIENIDDLFNGEKNIKFKLYLLKMNGSIFKRSVDSEIYLIVHMKLLNDI